MSRKNISALAAFVLCAIPSVASSELIAIFTADDYPTEAIRKHHEGLVRFRASIDAKGKVTKCEIIQSSGYPELDARTCKLVRDRAKFKPALDENGNPREDSWTSQTTWKLSR